MLGVLFATIVMGLVVSSKAWFGLIFFVILLLNINKRNHKIVKGI